MNQRNVEALTILLEDECPSRLVPKYSRELAEWLAARGVLVPSVLKDAIKFGPHDHYPVSWADCPLCGDDIGDKYLDRGIENLERIAKGEA